MQMNIELDNEEIKKAVQTYLREEKGLDAPIEEMSFDIRRTSNQPGSVGSPKVKSITCQKVDEL